MMSFREFVAAKQRLEEERARRLGELVLALEHEQYPTIPGTNNSFRLDAARTHGVQKHAHVYAKKGGKGKELYSVNIDGSGHDGSSGIKIPVKHAEHFRGMGFYISPSLALESLDYDSIEGADYEWLILFEDE
ncbi:hypothetical protein NJC38_02930 [Pseudomonas sp. 21LCFQ010]|uniref:hypothetical protein n=1 Tax=Pseudomonas sp. 21LCFQ010 TaxID=2957506 RepID=UPI0020981C92|nr:hypothetical protein [Pseudomonas sp. 21LCFQ010]MCO8161106.1 hypothetical protein [Pseudomonas sp. 21LCFQ010]